MATRDEPFSRVIRVLELEEVALVEEPHLDAPVLHEPANRARLERRDPRSAVHLLERVDLLLRDHPAVAHQHELPDKR
jgi:hypothetical protein